MVLWIVTVAVLALAAALIVRGQARGRPGLLSWGLLLLALTVLLATLALMDST